MGGATAGWPRVGCRENGAGTMSRAVVLAAAAGVLAAPGLLDLVVGARLPRGRGRRTGVALLARLGRGFGSRAPRGLEERIAGAGLETSVGDVMAVKAGAALAGLAAAVAMLPAAPGRLGVVLLACAPAAAFLAPDAWLRRRARRRRQIIEAELADVLDLLRVAVAAGLAPCRSARPSAATSAGIPGARQRRSSSR